MASTEPVFAYLALPEPTPTKPRARLQPASASTSRTCSSAPRSTKCSTASIAANASSAWWRRRTRSKGPSRPRWTTSPSKARPPSSAKRSSTSTIALSCTPTPKIEDVATVASHAQGLAQCRRFLSERLPGRSTITTSSTAESARLVMENPRVAGIANAFAAELYGARVEEREIEDHFGNQTSFALIGRQGHPPVFTAIATRPRSRCSCRWTAPAR